MTPEIGDDDADEDLRWMRRALALALRAEALGEVPVGAVAVLGGRVVGQGHNAPLSRADPSAHAEIVALRDAGRRLRNHRLNGVCVYATIEPCAMCAAALVHARVARLVFGAREPKAGAVASRARALDQGYLNHRVRWREGVLAERCAEPLRRFFRRRRAAR